MFNRLLLIGISERFDLALISHLWLSLIEVYYTKS